MATEHVCVSRLSTVCQTIVTRSSNSQLPESALYEAFHTEYWCRQLERGDNVISPHEKGIAYPPE